MTAIWLGLETVRAAMGRDEVMMTGDRRLIDTIESWLGLSPFAVEERRVA